MLRRKLLPTIAAAALMAGGGYLKGRNVGEGRRAALANQSSKLKKQIVPLREENQWLESKRSALQIFRVGDYAGGEGSGSAGEQLGRLRLHFLQRAREHQTAALSLLNKRGKLTPEDLEKSRVTQQLLEDLLPPLGHLQEEALRRRLAQAHYDLGERIERESR